MVSMLAGCKLQAQSHVKGLCAVSKFAVAASCPGGLFDLFFSWRAF